MRIFSLIILSLATTNALAAVDCKKPMTTHDINECASIDLEAAEVKLNAIYKKTLADLIEIGKDSPESLEARKQLIEAQRLWVKFREADCQASYTFHQSGTIRTLMYITCMIGHAEQRTEELTMFGR